MSRQKFINIMAVFAGFILMMVLALSCVQKMPAYESSSIKVYQDATVLSSAERTTDTTSSDMDCAAVGMILFVNVSDAGSGMLTPTLQFKDPVSGGYVSIWTATAGLNSATPGTYLFYPSVNTDAAATVSEAIDMPIPRTWRVSIKEGSAAITYSVGASYLLY